MIRVIRTKLICFICFVSPTTCFFTFALPQSMARPIILVFPMLLLQFHGIHVFSFFLVYDFQSLFSFLLYHLASGLLTSILRKSAQNILNSFPEFECMFIVIFAKNLTLTFYLFLIFVQIPVVLFSAFHLHLMFMFFNTEEYPIVIFLTQL